MSDSEKRRGRPKSNQEKQSSAIIHQSEYDKYLEISKNPLLNEDRIYYTSDINLIIDLAEIRIENIKSKITHLPLEEQQDILAKCTAVRALLARMGNHKSKAYGFLGYGKATYLDETSILAPRKTEMLEMFGRFYTQKEVHEIVIKEWDLPVSPSQISAFYKKHADQIKDLQEKYKQDFSHVRLGYKRSRLDEYSYIYANRKKIYDKHPSLENEKGLLYALSEIRKEMEGDEIKVKFDGKLDVNATINVHIQQDIMQKISIKEIILSKLAAKFGVDVKLLLYRLNKSMYAKFTGTKQAEFGLMEDEMIYPSQQIYDFDKIKKQNQHIKAEEAVVVEESTKPEKDTKKLSQLNEIKLALKQRLDISKDKLNETRERLDRND